VTPAPLTARRRRVTLVVLTALVVTVGAFTLLIGPEGFQVASLADPGARAAFVSTFLPLRAARVALAACVGAGLAATGAALQALLRNPLADPYVLGVSGGAAIGGAVVVGVAGLAGGVAGSALPSSLPATLPVSAGIGACASTALLAWFLARDREGRSETALLVGVVVNAFSWALIAVVRAALPAADTHVLTLWLIGTLSYPTGTEIVGVAAGTLVGVVVLVRRSGALALLAMGEDEAARLGVDRRREKLACYGAASLLVGVAVSTSGVVGFVGLVAPHGVRLVCGRDERLVVPASALAGALMLVIFDGLARLSFSIVGSELPTGALCAVFGAPLFAVGLWHRVRRPDVRVVAGRDLGTDR
jgi:iron complex transport system permease protein